MTVKEVGNGQDERWHVGLHDRRASGVMVSPGSGPVLCVLAWWRKELRDG